MRVPDLLDTLTAREFEEWRAYDVLYPLGSKGEYLRAGIIASSIMNCFIASGKEPIKPDFCLPKKPKTQEQIMMEFDSLMEIQQNAKR